MSDLARRPLARLLSLLSVLTVLVAVPATAGASVDISLNGTQVVVTGDAKANQVSVLGRRGKAADQVTVHVERGLVTTSNCTQLDARRIRCAKAPRIGKIVADAQAGNDRVEVQGRIPATVSGGKGSDTLLGGLGNDTLLGGPGSDRLNGRRGNDSMMGNSGFDDFHISRGNDQIDGAGDGADFVSIRGVRIVRIVGDTLRAKGYWTRMTGIDAIFHNGTRRRDVLDARRSDYMVGALMGRGNDRFIGSRKGDFVDGGKGNDLLVTRGGMDFVWGGGGRDAIRTGAASDFVLAGDGRADRQVRCGPGKDQYSADKTDPLSGCEVDIEKSNGTGGPVDVEITARWRSMLERLG